MDRRQFLKTVIYALAGLFILRWTKLFNSGKNVLKEARFYRRSDDLAG